MSVNNIGTCSYEHIKMTRILVFKKNVVVRVHCGSSVWGSVCQSEWIQSNGVLIYKCLHSDNTWHEEQYWMRAVWVHDNRQRTSKPLPLITPADGKYWIFTFAYSILAALTIWINMNQRARRSACPQLPTNPFVDPAFINIRTSLFQKVSMQSVITETLSAIHTSTNRTLQCAAVFQSTRFTWHFNCNTPVRKYQYKAVSIYLIKSAVFFCYLLLFYFCPSRQYHVVISVLVLGEFTQ